MSDLDEDALQQLYTWIDDIPLSRPKKNVARDFSDGVLVAEIVHHFIPKIVDLHNYSSANSSTQKMDNWNLMSRKCFRKMAYIISPDQVKGVVSCAPGIIEVVLIDIRHHIEQYLARRKAASMLENNEVHDELYQSDGYSNISEQPNGYHPNINPYGYNPYVDPYTQPHQAAQMAGEIPPYQYQSQPHVIQDIRAKPPEQTGEQKLSPRVRKPVTQATKMAKTKPPAKNQTNNDPANLRMALEEKEQALLSSQETVQILQAKVRRLEHLLHLKDLRINELRGGHQPPIMPPQQPLQQQLQQPLPQTLQQALHSPQKHILNAHPPRHLLYNQQGYPLPPTYGGFPPHPPLPQIGRPHDDPRK